MANTSSRLNGPDRDQSGDRLDQSAELKYVGDLFNATPVYITGSGGDPDLDTSYNDPSDFVVTTAGEAVIDCKSYDTLLVIVDYVKVASTDLRLKALFGQDDDESKLTIQEDREDNSGAGVVAHEAIEHKWTATGRYYLYLKRTARYAKIQFKVTGATGATDKLAISVFGQNRER